MYGSTPPGGRFTKVRFGFRFVFFFWFSFMTLRFSETLWLWKWGISLLARSSMGRSGSGEREKRRAWLLQSRIRNLNSASSSPCGSSSTEIPLSSRMTHDCMLPVSFPIELLHKTNKRKLFLSDWCIDRSRYRNNPLQQSEVAFVSKRSFSKWWSLLASVSSSPSHPPHPSFLFFALVPMIFSTNSRGNASYAS